MNVMNKPEELLERKSFVSARLQVLTAGMLMIEVLGAATMFRLKKRLPTFREIVMPECFILNTKINTIFRKVGNLLPVDKV
jgi:hypothetical protein